MFFNFDICLFIPNFTSFYSPKFPKVISRKVKLRWTDILKYKFCRIKCSTIRKWLFIFKISMLQPQYRGMLLILIFYLFNYYTFLLFPDKVNNHFSMCKNKVHFLLSNEVNETFPVSHYSDACSSRDCKVNKIFAKLSGSI